ncbi:MAG: efflux RND transporter periplasmic adaptor subunit, partial [Planctomycetes bacterium]|nr:efflux RND transporter periplasmic adaptor subunit [Planctomycetota bacterium]
MHPQVRLPGPGPCPLCGMDLVPVVSSAGGARTEPRRLALSEAARRLAEVETVPVQRRIVEAEVRMVGKVDYDETRVRHITAWVPGRLDRLYVDYTGIAVRPGDHMAELYSPELLSTQEELVQAIRALERLDGSPSELVRRSTAATVEAARDKLRLLGLTADQVAEVEHRGSATDRVTIHAPAGGIVISKDAREGEYVQTGTRVYTIADLSRVWVRLDAYEQDLRLLRYGQAVRFTAEAWPGEPFDGRIAFIDPVLTDSTRTVKLRVNVENPHGRLRPGMFVHAAVRARVAEDGRVVDTSLAGRWVSPMHPEVVKDGPGTCDVCGMPLVRAEELGYVDEVAAGARPPLVIPVTAPLLTGRRAVVYVRVPDAAEPTYEGREVLLGGRAGDFYLVAGGLEEGEEVVVRGAFKIDSALQIEGRPSMMSPGTAPPAEAPRPVHHPGNATPPPALGAVLA